MISNFFSGTKPINYLVTIGFTVVLFVLATLLYEDLPVGVLEITAKIGTLLVLTLTIFTLNPILTRNKLSELNSYTMLFYGLLLAAFLALLRYDTLVISNFLIVLSIDKVLSLKHENRTTYKIFEASLLVFVSAFFNEWSLIFLIPVYLGIYAYCPAQPRHWITPLAALITVTIIALGHAALTDGFSALYGRFVFLSKKDFELQEYYGLLFYVGFSLIIMGIALVKLNNRGMGRAVSLRILASYSVLGVALTFVSADFGIHTISYTFFATAVFLTNYFETIQKRRLKEGLLLTFILVPLVLVAVYISNTVSL